jgi:hypothetical protein
MSTGGYIQYDTNYYYPTNALSGGYFVNSDTYTRYYHQNITSHTEDNDTPAISIFTEDCISGYEVSEGGKTCDVGVKLKATPSANVTFTLSLIDYLSKVDDSAFVLSTKACFDSCTGSTIVKERNITFTPDDWNTTQTNTLQGNDDSTYEGAK